MRGFERSTDEHRAESAKLENKAMRRPTEPCKGWTLRGFLRCPKATAAFEKEREINKIRIGYQ